MLRYSEDEWVDGTLEQCNECYNVYLSHNSYLECDMGARARRKLEDLFKFIFMKYGVKFHVTHCRLLLM